jgi:hypothetical protein
MIYHVTDKWDGDDLKSLSQQMDWCDETAKLIAENWPEVDPGEYYHSDGQYIHCHTTLVEAKAFLLEFRPGGDILSIDVDSDDFDGQVEMGREYPHPVVRRRIPAGCIQNIPLAALNWS